MYNYFKYRDYNKVDCYFELDINNNCLRALYISDVFDDYKNFYYVEDEQYQLPNSFKESELETMTKINKTEFKKEWEKEWKEEDNDICFLLKCVLLERN